MKVKFIKTVKPAWYGLHLLIGIGLASLMLPSLAQAATFRVTSTADLGDGTCTAAGSGDGCTLREAITAANRLAGTDEIDMTALDGSIELTSALPNLSTSINLIGPGASLLTVRRNSSAATSFRIFTVSNGTTSGPSVAITGIAIADGRSGGDTSNYGYGSKICPSKGSTLMLTNCTLSGNSVNGGTLNSSSYGGGIYPGSSSCGRAATAWPTVCWGAAAMRVYTKPRADQAKHRSSGSFA